MVDISPAELTPSQLVHLMLEHIEQLEHAQNNLRRSLVDEAHADFHYRDAKADAWEQVEGRNADERIAKVDAAVGTLRLHRDLAVANSKADLEDVRNKRQSLSALQSAAHSIREEAAFSRVGPQLDMEQARYTASQAKRENEALKELVSKELNAKQR